MRRLSVLLVACTTGKNCTNLWRLYNFELLAAWVQGENNNFTSISEFCCSVGCSHDRRIYYNISAFTTRALLIAYI